MSIATFKDQDGHPCVPSIIDGQPVILGPETKFPVHSAEQQKIVHYGQTTTKDLAVRAVESAAKAFKTFKKTTVAERRGLLLAAADLFEKKAENAKNRQMTETSADPQFAGFNAHATSLFCREAAAGLQAATTGESSTTMTGADQIVIKEPVGPVLLIMPWNGALALPVRGVASALAAGCTVVLKASELCPWTHYIVVETFLEAGFPPGSVNLIMADRSAGPAVTETVIEHPALKKIEFIGSAPVGRAIGVVAAKHLKPIIMELGDQSPLIVLDDADLEKAAEMAVRGGMVLHGQVCFATERIIVQASVKDKFYGYLKAAIEATPSAGTAVSTAFAEKAKATIDEAVKSGAKFLAGNSEMTGPASLRPSVLTDVGVESHLSKNEGFAPTMFTVGVEDDEEAIAEANSREGGLSASIFTSNHGRGLRMAKELEFGQVGINLPTNQANPAGPITGWKGSGWGSHGGRFGIELFLQLKAVSIAPEGSFAPKSKHDMS